MIKFEKFLAHERIIVSAKLKKIYILKKFLKNICNNNLFTTTILCNDLCNRHIISDASLIYTVARNT